MNSAATQPAALESRNLIAVKLVRNPLGEVIAWRLFDEGRGHGRIEYTNLVSGNAAPTTTWHAPLKWLRAATPCAGAVELTGWTRVL